MRSSLPVKAAVQEKVPQFKPEMPVNIGENSCGENDIKERQQTVRRNQEKC